MNKHLTIGNLIKISLISALLTQISHAAFVFERISHEENEILKTVLSYIFAISLELSIYIFTMKGKRNSAIAFGIISALVNVFYYWYPVSTDSLNFLSSVVVSLIVPTIIYVYSDVIEDKQKRKVGRPVGSINIPKVEKSNNMPRVTKIPKIPKRNVENVDNILRKKNEDIKPSPIFSEETRPTKEKIILKESIKKNIKKSKNDENN
jgi:hypothetical protein